MINLIQCIIILETWHGHFEIVKLLVENKANINNKDKDGKSAIILASEKGYLDILKYLVKNGANVNDKSNCKDTVLMFGKWTIYNKYH